MKDRFAIDTNILFYALDKDSEKHQEALKFLKKSRNKEAALPLRALSECYSLAIHRNNVNIEEAAEFVHDLKHDPGFEVIEAGRKVLNQALGAESDFWDKMIKQTALENGYEVIYTENTSDFEDVEAINPLE
ncbi:MAG: PIN domain-containing protein [Candidatus Nanohalobium sp.]